METSVGEDRQFPCVSSGSPPSAVRTYSPLRKPYGLSGALQAYHHTNVHCFIHLNTGVVEKQCW